LQGIFTPILIESKLELDVEKILKAIAKLEPDKSQGPDELSPKLLIKTGNEIASATFTL